MISTVDVVLSGTFDSSNSYVTIDGTKYISEQTVTVAKGTSVTVYCSGAPSYINLNGTTIAQGTPSRGAEYTFAVTDNCSIVITYNIFNRILTADITMPA